MAKELSDTNVESEPGLTQALASWPDWAAEKPTLIRKLKGGLTNKSYLISAGTMECVLRINAANSQDLSINRSAELQAMEMASAAGIAPEPLYCDVDTGFLITPYYPNPQPARQAFAEQLLGARDVARITCRIHRLGIIAQTLDLEQRAKAYWQHIDRKRWPALALLAIERQMPAIYLKAKRYCDRLWPCHNDLVFENLLLGRNGDFIVIDWEYAAMGDPYFDLALIVEEQQYNEQDIDDLLRTYHHEQHQGRPVHESSMDRLLHLRVIYRYLDLLWYCVQRDDNKSPGEIDLLENKLGHIDDLICQCDST